MKRRMNYVCSLHHHTMKNNESYRSNGSSLLSLLSSYEGSQVSRSVLGYWHYTGSGRGPNSHPHLAPLFKDSLQKKFVNIENLVQSLGRFDGTEYRHPNLPTTKGQICKLSSVYFSQVNARCIVVHF